MRESYWGYAVIVLGIVAITTMWFIANVTRTDQNNYNVLKEAVEASMYDAIDLAEYRKDGTITMDADNFVETFLRRFSQNTDLNSNYLVEIFDISETPPKVSLRVTSSKTSPNIDPDTDEVIEVDVTNNIDAILESRFQTKDYTNPNFKGCTSTNRCVISIDYLTNIAMAEGVDYIFWTVYPNPLKLPSSIMNGQDASKLHVKLIDARWKRDKEITQKDLDDRERTKCDMFLGYNIGKGFTKMSDCDATKYTAGLSNVQTETKVFQVQVSASNVLIGAQYVPELKLEAYFTRQQNKNDLANWITMDWQYWFE